MSSPRWPSGDRTPSALPTPEGYGLPLRRPVLYNPPPPDEERPMCPRKTVPNAPRKLENFYGDLLAACGETRVSAEIGEAPG